jgi:hypothetical protein
LTEERSIKTELVFSEPPRIRRRKLSNPQRYRIDRKGSQS